ncbi:unnamed protein product, partial [marine sediment metagenome]
MAEQSVTLQPSESRVVSFEAIPKEAKTYQVVVNGLTGSFTALAAFAGFSLMIKNPPAGTVYWATEKGLFKLSEAAWWLETPAPWDIHIVFLNASYECPSGDPGCEGVECSFAPEDGHHYLIDCSTCQITENPTPPPGPPPVPTEPGIVSVNIPSAKACGGFMP